MRTRENDPQLTNNALHEAILARDNEAALKLVASMKPAELNQDSIGNTPLMLALKTANFPVARALLAHEDVKLIDEFKNLTTDQRGISLLQLACAWREDDIIRKLLEKYHEAALSTDCRFDLEKLRGVNVFNKKFVTNRTLANIYSQPLDEERVRRAVKINSYHKSIVESPALAIDTAPELTDAFLFHSKSICLNLKLLDEDQFKEYPSSQDQFAKDLMTALTPVLTYRNAKPVEPDIVKMLSSDTPEPTETGKVKPKL